MSHWACSIIGARYQCGAVGPDAFDCWGLVRWVYKTQFEIDLPLMAGLASSSVPIIASGIEAALETGYWEPTEPEDGCVVLLSKGRVPHHVGVYIRVSGGLVLHANKPGGVVADSRRGLWLQGFKVLGYYKYIDGLRY